MDHEERKCRPTWTSTVSMIDGDIVSYTAKEAKEGDEVCGVEITASCSGDVHCGETITTASTTDRSLSWSLSDKSESAPPYLSGPQLPNEHNVDNVTDDRNSPVYALRKRQNRIHDEQPSRRTFDFDNDSEISWLDNSTRASSDALFTSQSDRKRGWSLASARTDATPFSENYTLMTGTKSSDIFDNVFPALDEKVEADYNEEALVITKTESSEGVEQLLGPSKEAEPLESHMSTYTESAYVKVNGDEVSFSHSTSSSSCGSGEGKLEQMTHGELSEKSALTMTLEVVDDQRVEQDHVVSNGSPETCQIIDVLEPLPDQLFNELIARTHPVLWKLILNTSNVRCLIDAPKALFTRAPMILFRDELPTVIVTKDLGAQGFQFSSCRQLNNDRYERLDVISDPLGRQISLSSFPGQNTISTVSRAFQLVAEIVRLRSYFEDWRAEPSKVERPKVAVKPDPEPSFEDWDNCSDDSFYEYDEDAADLYRDEELRAVMAQTGGGNDISALLPSFSEDSMASLDSDDGLETEIVGLRDSEAILRSELEQTDMIIKGVYDRRRRQQQQQKRERSASAFPPDPPEERPKLKTPSARRVRFASTNQEFIFISDPHSVHNNRDGLAESLFALCDEIFVALEDAADEMGYVCARAYERFTEQHKRRSKPSSKGPTKISTVYYCY